MWLFVGTVRFDTDSFVATEVVGGQRAAYDLRRDETVSVESDRTYEQPHDSMFISPSRNWV